MHLVCISQRVPRLWDQQGGNKEERDTNNSKRGGSRHNNNSRRVQNMEESNWVAKGKVPNKA